MIKPMKFYDLKPLIDWTADDPFHQIARWFNPDNALTPKIDGCGVWVELGERNKVHSATRGIDRTANFPHVSKAGMPELAGTVLQAELVAPPKPGMHKPYDVLPHSTSLMGSLPARSVGLQKTHGLARLYVFDVVAVTGLSVMDRPYARRREMLELIMASWREEYPQLPVELVPHLPVTSGTLTGLIELGYEGGILRPLGSLYAPGRRSGGWKIKTSSTAEVFISGWRPGENANEGKVGSFEVSILVAGQPVEVGHCGNFTRDMRDKVSAPDGSLREEFYDRVISVTAQGVGNGGKLRHCLFVGWRDDATKADCDAAQLDLFPRV